MSSVFLTPELLKLFYVGVISELFPNMNSADGKLLFKYYVKILDIIRYSFLLQNEIFREQLMQNNFRDARGILLILLPFINDESNLADIRTINDIYISKNKQVDINNEEPKYKFSNLQYGRCKRYSLAVEEIQFNESHLAQNFYLLVDTIRLISKKMYVNWVNVRPYLFQKNYLINTDLYKISQITFQNKQIQNFNPITEFSKLDSGEITQDIFRKKLEGLQMDDIYDTITNFLYYDIKKIKWLIYEIKSKSRFDTVYTFINSHFPQIIDSVSQNLEWMLVSQDDRDKISSQWAKLVKGDVIFNGDKMDKSEHAKVLKAFVLFFDLNYKNIDLAIKNDGYRPLISDIDDKYEEDGLREITFDKVIRSATSITSKHLYEYIKDCLLIFKTTFYGMTFGQDVGDLFDISHKFSLKNLYNFAKSLCHITHENKYQELPRFWRSMTQEQQEMIAKRLYSSKTEVLSWFNITRNLKLLKVQDAQKTNIDIFASIQKNIILIVMTVLAQKGILSKLNFNPEVTDMSMGNNNSKIVKWLDKNIFSEETEANSIYYLTNTPYNTLKFTIRTPGTNDKNISYFTYNRTEEGRGWYLAYALNWVSQINFFHRYLNNRVIYVTGATGVGKSTQVPKLLMYATKAFDYNDRASVVCTQPRKTPTKNNAKIVSLELGVPITDNLGSENYYVQFKHQDESHVKNKSHLSLKFVTDGSLNVELNNPFMKKEAVDKSTKNLIIGDKNIYDIVVIDEAHEHNANMDFILTYMRHVATYNNTVKLVIVSATMQDDEPVYRRYYRNINDNRMYPLNFQNKNNNLDRINVDRRVHISPPGQTTRHKITEFYIDEIQIKDPVELVLDIIRRDPLGGDILVFQPGVGEISNNLEILNQKLPDNVIAVPYHSMLKPKQRDIVENIHTEKFNIRMNRLVPFNEIDDPKRGTKRYDRVVVVATNIAEASITINTLKYVIETGTQKTARYDYKRSTSVLELTYISESSRLQRRGRVGRTSSGTVYYLYPKGTMETNKRQFNIAIQEISRELYRRLSDGTVMRLSDGNNDPNNSKNILEIGNAHLALKSYFNMNQYFDYFGNAADYDYENYVVLPIHYTDGFSLATILDERGDFYIVHPEELSINRNIMGLITSVKSGVVIKYENNKVESLKMNSFLQTLIDDLYLVKANNNLYKTQLGKQLFDIQDELMIEDKRLFMTLIYSMVYDCSEDIIKFISMKMAVNKFTDTLIVGNVVNGKFRKDLNIIKNVLVGTEKSSDVIALITIMTKIQNVLNRIRVDIDIDKNMFFCNIKSLMIHPKYKQIFETMPNYQKLISVLSTTPKTELYNEIRKRGIVNKIILEFINNDIPAMFIKYISFMMSLSFPAVIDSITSYLNIKNSIYCLKNNLTESLKPVDLNGVVTFLKKNIRNNMIVSLDDRINASLVLGFSRNITRKISNSDQYISINQPELTDLLTIKTIGRSPFKDTLVDNSFIQKYLLFIDSDITENNMSIVHHVNPKYLTLLSHIYIPSEITKKYQTVLRNAEYTSKMQYKSVSNYKDTLDDILNDLKSYYNKNIWLSIADLDPRVKDVFLMRR